MATAPPTETGFSVTYDGPAFAQGRMEVRDLAPALLALADLFREANTIAQADAPAVSLHITATEPGSFVIDLAIVADIAIYAAVTFFT